ncbi:SlyX family protein, partial [Acinetobacter baumannii]
MGSPNRPPLPWKGRSRPMTDTSLTNRIDALEMRIAYQDETIEDLNKTITAQW